MRKRITRRRCRRAALASVCVAAAFVFTSTSSARDLGVDVSHFQDEAGISQTRWNSLAAEPRSFAYMKATEGLLPPGNVDFTWDENVERAGNAGILTGVYHFARPDNRPLVSGAIDEANHFVATAGAAMTAGHLRPVIDVERGSALTTTALTDWVIAFIDRVVELRGPSAKPIIYTTSFFTTSELDSRLADYDLWIRSNTGASIDPHTESPTGLGVFNDWLIWQYHVRPASGGETAIDLDVLHNESASLADITIVPEPGTAAMMLLFAACAARRRRARA